MYRILCVEDAPDVVAILEATLTDYQLTFATSVKQSEGLLQRDQFSLAILDIELPDGSGFEIMASMQGRQQAIPVIFLTCKQDFASKVSAFSMGADDFIVKPFDPRELRLRVDSKLRKVATAAEANTTFRIGTITCNVQEQRIVKNTTNEAVDLTSLEFRIFYLLARTPNKIFSREEILDRVWGHSVSVTDRAIDVHISNLRKKLSLTNVSIEAVIGSGYRILVGH